MSDYDKGGLLDLFVPSYLNFDLSNLPVPCRFKKRKSERDDSVHVSRTARDVRAAPRGLKGAKANFFVKRRTECSRTYQSRPA